MTLLERVDACIVRESNRRNWRACETLAALRRDLLMIEYKYNQKFKPSYIGIDPF